jgi:hypothetical protein
MAWRSIERNAIGEGTPFVTVGSTSRYGRATHAQMVVNISATLARFIRVRPGDRIELEIGTLADDGWMRVSKGKQQKATRHGHKGSIRVRFSGRRLGVTCGYTPQTVKHKTGTRKGKTYIIFMLPSWAHPGKGDN